jgi:hypothetical protein
MNRHDQELLDKQLRNVPAARRDDGVMIPVLLAVFFSGMAVGGFFYAYGHTPIQVASDQAAHHQQIASNEVPIFAPLGTTQR